MIIEYEEKYLDSVRDLLTELEEYIVEIDEDHLDQVHEEYWEKMALVDLKDVEENHGKCYLYLEDNEVLGLIMGTIPPFEEYDYLDYKCPKRGVITELVVSKKSRGNNIGTKLMKKLEEYFKEEGCKYVFVEVFAYNKRGINFYQKLDYHNRMHHMLKPL